MCRVEYHELCCALQCVSPTFVQGMCLGVPFENGDPVQQVGTRLLMNGSLLVLMARKYVSRSLKLSAEHFRSRRMSAFASWKGAVA